VVGWPFDRVALLLTIFSRGLKEEDSGIVMYKLLGSVRSMKQKGRIMMVKQ
jgi:hypothetical protein